MQNETKALHILSTTVDFLGAKYGCTAQDVVRGLAEKNAKVWNDFATLAAEGIAALA